jgi:hypothetical protein
MYVSSFFQRACFTDGDQAPAFTQAYRYFQEAEAGYLAAFQDVDSSGLEKWQKKRNNELAPLRHSNDLDKSQFIIYTGEE